MSKTMKRLYSLILGGWGALLAWVLLDLVIRTNQTIGDSYLREALTGGIIGLLTGMLIAGFEKFNNTGRTVPTLQASAIGIVTGFVFGALGLFLANLIFLNLRVGEAWSPVLRVVGWGIFGLGVGLGPGIATLSPAKAGWSGLGGLIGGIVGGIAFVLLVYNLGLDLTSRAWGFILIGLLVGTFIAILQIGAARAEIKIISDDPNYNKEYAIDKGQVTIGSGSSDDWVITYDRRWFPYNQLQPRHLEIRKTGDKYMLICNYPQNCPFIERNNMRLPPQPSQELQNGDIIAFGTMQMAFKVIRR
ncbi:MAG: FHA domain-containing protein [Anaerolineae bacterium]